MWECELPENCGENSFNNNTDWSLSKSEWNHKVKEHSIYVDKFD